MKKDSYSGNYSFKNEKKTVLGKIKDRFSDSIENVKDFWSEHSILISGVTLFGLVAGLCTYVIKGHEKEQEKVDANLKSFVAATVDTTRISSKIVGDYTEAVGSYALSGNVESKKVYMHSKFGITAVNSTNVHYDKINEKINDLKETMIDNKISLAERSMQDTAVFFNGNERTLYISPDRIFDASRKELLTKAVDVIGKTADATFVLKK